MKQKILEFYDQLDKAIDRAVWLQFEHRNSKRKFVVYDGPKDNFAVSDLQTAEEMEMDSHFYSLPDSYFNLSHKRLEAITKDTDMLQHWEELLGKFSVMEGELLRFIIRFQIPVEKLICHELSNRGVDQNNQWVGVEASKKIWRKDESEDY